MSTQWRRRKCTSNFWPLWWRPDSLRSGKLAPRKFAIQKKLPVKMQNFVLSNPALARDQRDCKRRSKSAAPQKTFVIQPEKLGFSWDRERRRKGAPRDGIVDEDSSTNEGGRCLEAAGAVGDRDPLEAAGEDPEPPQPAGLSAQRAKAGAKDRSVSGSDRQDPEAGPGSAQEEAPQCEADL